MKRLLIISDVHGEIELAKKIIEKEQHDYLIFSGDWGSSDDSLITGKNVLSVRGNHQEDSHLPEELTFTVNGVNFLLAHGHLFMSIKEYVDRKKIYQHAINNFDNINVIIHGHSHVKRNKEYKDIRIINPGSISIPRDDYASYAIMEIKDNGEYIVEFKPSKMI